MAFVTEKPLLTTPRAWPFWGMIPGSAGLIYADPPWDYQTWSARGQQRSANRHYQCMATDEICAMPVADLAADDAVLAIWEVPSMRLDALRVIEAWGFQYKTVAFTWVKTRPSGKEFMGMGRWSRGNPEQCLLATRGKPRRRSAAVRELLETLDEGTAIHGHIREHSRKPDEARTRLESLVTVPAGLDRVELFARTQTPGWCAWGNQTTLFVEQGDG